MQNTKDLLDVSVIIPFKDKADMTNTCLRTLHTYGNPVKEVILVSNNSNDTELEKVETAAAKYANTRVVVYNHPFNYQKINNWAAKQATGKVIMLLNNDIELDMHAKSVMGKMYALACKKTSGAVGCVLLYEDRKTIQHAGVYLVPGATANELYRGKPLRKILQTLDEGNLPYNIRNQLRVAAVTAASVMFERSKYNEVKGLNEDFIIGGGDVDICLRLEEKGYANWLVGYNDGYMVHKESKSRSMLSVPYSDFTESYKSYIRHFSLETGDKYLHASEVARVK